MMSISIRSPAMGAVPSAGNLPTGAFAVAPIRTRATMRRESCGGMLLNIADLPFGTADRESGPRVGSPLRDTSSGAALASANHWSADLAAGREVALEALSELRQDGEALIVVIRLSKSADDGSFQGRNDIDGGLPKWRLKRAKAYIEENLEEPISLATIANSAGLSPTYFAALFKVSTGLRPHDYVMRRRIARAKEQLLDPKNSILEVAIDVGFQTQAHFTTSFKKIVGDTPCRWRNKHYSELSFPQHLSSGRASR